MLSRPLRRAYRRGYKAGAGDKPVITTADGGRYLVASTDYCPYHAPGLWQGVLRLAWETGWHAGMMRRSAKRATRPASARVTDARFNTNANPQQ